MDENTSPYFKRVDRFCEIFGRLYSKVSEISEHTAGVEVTDRTCLPKTEDYQLYIENLRGKGQDDFVFVVNSMATSHRILPKINSL